MADTFVNPDINWDNIIGEKTLQHGGYIGDLMQITRAHVADSLEKGEVTQQEVGAIYGAMINNAFKEAINYELTEAIREQEILSAQAKIDLTLVQTELEQEKVVLMGVQIEVEREKIDLMKAQVKIEEAKIELQYFEQELIEEKIKTMINDRRIADEMLLLEQEKLKLTKIPSGRA